MNYRRLVWIGTSLFVTTLNSCTLLPFLIPSFRAFTAYDLLEVVLWQAIVTVGWPFAIFGSIVDLISSGGLDNLTKLTLTLMYPSILFLLIHCIMAKNFRPHNFVLLNLLIVLSFVAIWYSVLNGYDFMVG